MAKKKPAILQKLDDAYIDKKFQDTKELSKLNVYNSTNVLISLREEQIKNKSIYSTTVENTKPTSIKSIDLTDNSTKSKLKDDVIDNTNNNIKKTLTNESIDTTVILPTYKKFAPLYGNVRLTAVSKLPKLYLDVVTKPVSTIDDIYKNVSSSPITFIGKLY